jgi:hypothetical protein
VFSFELAVEIQRALATQLDELAQRSRSESMENKNAGSRDNCSIPRVDGVDHQRGTICGDSRQFPDVAGEWRTS